VEIKETKEKKGYTGIKGFKGEKGEKGLKGNRGHRGIAAFTRVITAQNIRVSSQQVVVTVENPEIFESGMIVYISSVGYFKVLESSLHPSNLRLDYLYGSETDDSQYIRNHDLIIPSGIRGNKGERGAVSVESEKNEDKYYFITPSPERTDQQTIYIKHEERVSTENNVFDIFSDKIQILSKSCKNGKILLSGSCSWNIFSFSQSSCSIADRTENCFFVELTDLSSLEEKECGFFCFFYHLEPILESSNTFSCRYTPPSHYGVEQFGFVLKHDSSDYKREEIDNRVIVVSVNTLCASFN